jgi:transposase-like protein
MLHRIRLAMRSGSFEKMEGETEADETFVGGLAKFMHKKRRKSAVTGTGGSGKAVVMGILERKGKRKTSRVRARVMPNTQRETLHREIRDAVELGSRVNTDAWAAYRGLSPDYVHKVVDHAVEYVRGTVHTNGLENFWSLLKRTIKGTYVSVEAFHLGRYLDEQGFRFNEREGVDADRFKTVLSSVMGKRLTYRELTGNDQAPQTSS